MRNGPTQYIAVFGSSTPVEGSPDYETARAMGRALAEAGFGVLNGGYGGTMEASARGAVEAGGATAGVTVGVFGREPNRWIRQVIETDSLLQRLETLLTRASGYVALKGGSGTLVEIALAWEYLNKRLMPEKPLILLGGFWGPLLELLGSEETWFKNHDATRVVAIAADPAEAVAALKARLNS